MLNFEEFQEKYPLKKEIIDGKPFYYRHLQHETSKETLVLLVGGLGISDLGFTQMQGLFKEFSVITFDYHKNYPTLEELLAAIHGLLNKLDLKVWFVGQSLGGIFAQLLATKYPDICKGLVLSNTGCLSETMSETALEATMTTIENSKKSKKVVNLIPFNLFKKLISKKVMKKYGADFNTEEKEILLNFCSIMERTLEKSYEIHMIDLLLQLEDYLHSRAEDFAFLEGKVLLILSEDDHTFHTEVKEALIDLMPKPKVITDLTGGHLALLVRSEEYVNLISSFIL